MFPQLAAVLTAPGLQNYFLQCVAPVPAPQLTPFSAWALRHEYHLQYLVLSLAQKAVGSCLQRQPPPGCPPYFSTACSSCSSPCSLAAVLHLPVPFLTQLCFELSLLPSLR